MFDRACVFVDGENLRHSLVDLFHPHFKTEDYLPNAEWGNLFGYLVGASGAQTHVRTYWYTVNHLDFRPWKFPREMDEQQRLFSKHKPFAERIHEPGLTTSEKSSRVEEIGSELRSLKEKMQQRFNGWAAIQEGIAGKVDALEFRRAGAITYDLFKQELLSEKAVDVKLATDLLELRAIYDVAVIVSGDQDYVPAVQAIKDSGKRVMNVCFLKKGGTLLPGGARRLNQCTDRVIQFPFDKLQSFMNFANAAAVK
jgi:uncharacterized LabA/DUF88 family protein